MEASIIFLLAAAYLLFMVFLGISLNEWEAEEAEWEKINWTMCGPNMKGCLS